MHSLEPDRLFLRPKAFYFFYFAALAAFAPYLVLYYRSLGMSSASIGMLTALPPIINLVGGPLWAAAADARGARRVMLIVTLAGSFLTGYAYVFISAMAPLLILVILHALFSSPVIALADSSILNILGEKRHLYGRQRLWGAVGWGLAAPLVGELTQRFGLSQAFTVYGLLGIGCLVCALLLPTGIPRTRGPFWVGMRQLFKQPAWIIFLLTMFLAGMGSSASSSYLFLRMQDQGAVKSLMGLTLTAGSVSELVVFTLSSHILRALGPRRSLLIALAASTLQLLLYSVIRNPAWILAAQLLHGLSFSLRMTSAVSYADASAPPGLGTTAQAIYGSVGTGLASALGNLLAGLIYDSAGSTVVFRFASLFAATGFMLLLLSGRRHHTVNAALF